jgi:magnesium chelatase family protein
MRLSGPLLDRLDVHVTLPPVQLATFNAAPAESSAVVRARVLSARKLQLERYTERLTAARTNGRLPTRDFELVLKPTRAAQRLLGKAADHMGLSARGFGKVLRVARTIADLEAEPRVQENHVAEALHSRLFDREM